MSKSTPGDMPGARQSDVILVSGGRRDLAQQRLQRANVRN
jgi:hypothetical protein